MTKACSSASGTSIIFLVTWSESHSFRPLTDSNGYFAAKMTLLFLPTLKYTSFAPWSKYPALMEPYCKAC